MSNNTNEKKTVKKEKRENIIEKQLSDAYTHARAPPRTFTFNTILFSVRYRVVGTVYI